MTVRTGLDGRATERLHVHEHHEAALQTYYDRLRRNGLAVVYVVVCLPILALMIEVAALALGRMDWGIVLMGLTVGTLGFVVIRFPFATTQTVEWLGVERAIRAARALGILTVLLGVGVVALGVRMMVVD